MSNQLVHFESGSKGPQKTGECYEKALGWKVTTVPPPNYYTVDAGGGPKG